MSRAVIKVKKDFPYHYDKNPDTFIQWKGTDVCMDWYCKECGHHNHVDGDFCYEVECEKCHTVYVVGQNVKLYKLNTEKYKRWNED